jgi:glycogen debranching enzyme
MAHHPEVVSHSIPTVNINVKTTACSMRGEGQEVGMPGAQPMVHELVTVLCAPNAAISAPDGQLHGDGAQGTYRHDRRGLTRLEIEISGARLVPAGFRQLSAGVAGFHGIVRMADDRAHDPSLHYVRTRRVTEAQLTDSWSLRNHSPQHRTSTVTITAAADLTTMQTVRSGCRTSELAPVTHPESTQWTSDGGSVRLAPSRPPDAVATAGPNVRMSWEACIPPGGSWELELVVQQNEDGAAAAFFPQRPAVDMRLVAPEIDVDGAATGLLRHCLSDLDALLLVDPQRPDSPFLAAGSPWYFTLFGRDSLWAARFLLPQNVALAAGTLRALAALQGVRDDPETGEQPGKIPHELRRAAFDIAEPGNTATVTLPPLHYGTVDATALWVCLLVEAWQAGMPASEVAELLPALRAALQWITVTGDPDGDGFCEYQGSVGLTNQGWKDSRDGIRWADGSIAERPLALCEVQGYAHAAAMGAADLLDAFGADGERWRAWASGLRSRFRAAFWVDDEHGRYPAIALDAEKRPVTGPASNMAHLLGTGLLNAEESDLVARQLASPWLDGGYGLRSLSTRTTGFNPLSYHCGSVWPHDTAIAILGLAAEGHHRTAGALAEGLLRAAAQFGFRLPELYGGTSYHAGEPAVAYPAACAPQAWSAAGAVAVLRYLYGSEVTEGHAAAGPRPLWTVSRHRPSFGGR